MHEAFQITVFWSYFYADRFETLSIYSLGLGDGTANFLSKSAQGQGQEKMSKIEKFPISNMGRNFKKSYLSKNVTDFVEIWKPDVESHSRAPHQKYFGKVKGQGQGHEKGEKYCFDHNFWTRHAIDFWFGPKCTYNLCARYAHGPFITRQDNFCATRVGMTSLYTSIFDFVKFYSPISSALFEISYPLFSYKYIYWMLTTAQLLVEIGPRLRSWKNLKHRKIHILNNRRNFKNS